VPLRKQKGRASRALRIFFATDVHGSDRCFRKFVNAAGAYDADVLILGGDIAGKGLVPVQREGDSIVVRRGGREMAVSVQVADLPDVNAPRVTVLRELELISLTPPIRAQYQIQSRQGALVNRVSDRIQQQIGLQSGDVIVQVNRTPIPDAQSVNRILTAYGWGVIRLYFERGGQIYATEFSLQ